VLRDQKGLKVVLVLRDQKGPQGHRGFKDPLVLQVLQGHRAVLVSLEPKDHLDLQDQKDQRVQLGHKDPQDLLGQQVFRDLLEPQDPKEFKVVLE
jgi:hypothetical protein